MDWALEAGHEHVQKNVPDPNSHLVITSDGAKLLGPVTKTYAYTMTGADRIIGVKFCVGALHSLLPQSISQCLDSELPVADVFGRNAESQLLPLLESSSDKSICHELQDFLKPFIPSNAPALTRVQSLVDEIKHNSAICKVLELAHSHSLSPRAIQRDFHQYIGLSPKWLIRKYRLRAALEALDAGTASALDIVEQLEYTDQSHLIRDFKEILGITPAQYSHDASAHK